MIRDALQRFMYGRYGTDQLNACLLLAYVALSLLSLLPHAAILGLIAQALVFFALFRTLSRNLSSRRAENAKFMKAVGPMLQWLRLQRTIRRDKEHRYFKCPNCGQQLRVPRGKGKITVTCRGCHATFQENS